MDRLLSNVLARAALWPTAFALSGCTRTSAQPHAAPVDDASAPVTPAVVDASVAPVSDAGLTLAAYCDGLTGWGESPEGITCRGEKVRPSCDVKEKKKLGALGKIVLVDEKVSEGAHLMLALVDASGHYAIIERVLSEECDLGEPADVSLELVSANESVEAGTPTATIVFDSLRNDPPYQSGPRVLSGERRSVQCRVGNGTPECDKPTKLGTFSEPGADKPPPFSKWKKGE